MSLGLIFPPPELGSSGLVVVGGGWMGQVEGGGSGGPRHCPGWQEGAMSARLRSSRSYFYRREGAWSPPRGGAQVALISRVTGWPTQALHSPHPSSSLSQEWCTATSGTCN